MGLSRAQIYEKVGEDLMKKTRAEVVVAPAPEVEGYRVHTAMRDSCPSSGIMSKQQAARHAQYLVRVLKAAGVSTSYTVQDEPFERAPLEFTD